MVKKVESTSSSCSFVVVFTSSVTFNVTFLCVVCVTAQAQASRRCQVFQAASLGQLDDLPEISECSVKHLILLKPVMHVQPSPRSDVITSIYHLLHGNWLQCCTFP